MNVGCCLETLYSLVGPYKTGLPRGPLQILSADMMDRLPMELRIGIGGCLSLEDLLVLRRVLRAWREAASICLQDRVRLLPARAHFATGEHVGRLILLLYRPGRGFRCVYSLLSYHTIVSNLVCTGVSNNG
jgi:hypothetical protein